MYMAPFFLMFYISRIRNRPFGIPVHSFKSLIKTYLDFWRRNINTHYLNTVFTQWVIQEDLSKIKIYTQL